MVGCASGEPNTRGADTYVSRLVYLIDEKQLTKDYEGSEAIIAIAG
jgi:hypothetical protein